MLRTQDIIRWRNCVPFVGSIGFTKIVAKSYKKTILYDLVTDGQTDRQMDRRTDRRTDG